MASNSSQWRRALSAILATAWLALVAAGSATSAHAQSIAGTVLDEDSLTPVYGAVVALLDADSARVRAVLTDADGTFELNGVAPDSYRLQAEMIGRQTVVAGPFTLGSNVDHRLLLPTRPIVLDGVEVSSDSRCSMDADAARGAYLVWSEVEKALRATELTRTSSTRTFRVAEYERRLLKSTRVVMSEQVAFADVVGGQEPFGSLSPAEVERSGYVLEDGDDLWIYGPNIEILLSHEFQATHCFALHRDRSRPGAIGLRFEPVEGRVVSDIAGTLWLDEESAELRTLEFAFGHLPRRLTPGEYTGAADFRRLEGGRWIVERWWLRAPDPDSPFHVREQAGEVVDIGG